MRANVVVAFYVAWAIAWALLWLLGLLAVWVMLSAAWAAVVGV